MMTSATRINVALALLVQLIACTIPSAVALDQYQDTNGDEKATTSQPVQLLENEATDQSSSNIHKPYHRFDFSGKLKTVPELQVGCADGNIVEQTQSPPQISIKKAGRKVRSYYPWSGKVQRETYPSISNWKPPTYQLDRPYFIPIYGAPGRIPIYYPPQPLLINPGSPIDNPPKKPYQGPTYLPPVDSTTMNITNRFNEDDDVRPIWDSSYPNNVAPTRRPIPQGGTTLPPPLVHNANATSGASSAALVPESFRPSVTQAEIPPPVPAGPSNCVWAIISCCSTAGEVRYDCFEQRGCPGSFWDNSPCNSDFAKAAIAAALNYYNTNNK